MTWRGIVGKSFTSIDDFSAYVDTVQFNLWRPKFVVVHNTSAPDLATYAKWQARGNPSDEQWALNLQGYYRDQMGWSAGPHLFVTPRSIIASSPSFSALPSQMFSGAMRRSIYRWRMMIWSRSSSTSDGA